MLVRIALGTVQFGLSYGVSNSGGQVPPTEVRDILEYAESRGVNLLDTAHGYGQSETVLGTQMPGGAPFRIVTKCAAIAGGDISSVTKAFRESLARLRVEKVYGLLVHNANDLLGAQGAGLFAEMQRLKADGLVEKIGSSIYDARQLDALVQKFPLDLVQLPLNILDQRLALSGHLKALHSRGTEIHVRSAFLQGLLLMPLDQLDAYFDPIRPTLDKYREYISRTGLSPLEAALLYLASIPEVDQAVLGVCSREQLKEIFDAYERIQTWGGRADFREFALTDGNFLNPGQWKLHSK